MSCQLSMLKMYICEFVSAHRYTSLSELQSFARRRQIEIKCNIPRIESKDNKSNSFLKTFIHLFQKIKKSNSFLKTSDSNHK